MFLAQVAPRPSGRHEQRIMLRQQPDKELQAAGGQQRSQAAQQQGQPAVAPGLIADEFEQICRLFGALSERDTGHTVVRVYKVVVERSHPQKGIGSSELADIESLNRLTALHHLNRLAELGMLEKRGPRYYPRDFEQIFDEFEKQAMENIKRARIIARQLERQE